jgi:hypothetical protein
LFKNSLQKLPVPIIKREKQNFLTPTRIDNNLQKSPSQTSATKINKYSHIQSKVKTFWTPQEMQRVGLKQMLARNGTSSASTSASSSTFTSPESAMSKTFSSRRSLQYQISGSDFAAKIEALRRDLQSIKSEPKSEDSS